MTGILDRIEHFLGTSPDEVQNRHRLIFFLLVFFCVCIACELLFNSDSSGRESLIKTFSNTITWLVGIYVAGAVASKKLPTPPKADSQDGRP
jgi:hypothetical protein